MLVMFERGLNNKNYQPGFFKQNLSAMVNMGEKQQCVAIYLINTPALAVKLSSWDLTRLGLAHADTALSILNHPILSNKIEGPYLSKLAEKHESVAKLILNQSEFLSKLKDWDLERILGAHIVHALNFLNNLTKAKKISGPYLYSLAIKNTQLAEVILNTPCLSNKLAVNAKQRILDIHQDTLAKDDFNASRSLNSLK